MVVFLLLLLSLVPQCFAQRTRNMLIGVQYRNYTNYQGALSDGTCCDNPALVAPNCPADECDTSFLPCFTYDGGEPCRGFYKSATPTTHDDNSFVIDLQIGNRPREKTYAWMTFVDSFTPGDLHCNIVAREMSGNFSAVIANFSFVIDWMETVFSNPPQWRQLVLTDEHAQLGIDVYHQCRQAYFGPTCDVHCSPTARYTCLNNGSKKCEPGWKGVECDQLVPSCDGSLCQNGGTCFDVLLGYVCVCVAPYSGNNCENGPTPPWTPTTAPPTITEKETTTDLTTRDSLTTAKVPESIAPVTIQTPGALPVNVAIPGEPQGHATETLPPDLDSMTSLSKVPNRPPSGDSDITIIVATAASVAGLLLILLALALLYFCKRMKRSPSREKITPSPPSYDDAIRQGSNEKLPGRTHAWTKEALRPPQNLRVTHRATAPLSLTSF